MKAVLYIQAAIGHLTKGFFFGLLFAVGVFFVLQLDQYYAQEEAIGELPIIHEIEDYYLEGWNAFSDILHLPEIEIPTLLASTVSPTHTQKLPDLTWNYQEVYNKLANKGFSKGKLRAAEKYLDYIDQHKEIAIHDMQESGVFASIKLAQALLESGAGRSKLARSTHNHFGIKARANKTGRLKLRNKQYDLLTDYDYTPSQPAIGVFKMTDDHHYDRFEKYRNVGDSYWRHTQLVTRNCTLGKVGCYSWIWKTFPVGDAKCDITSAANSFYSFSKLSPEYFFNGNRELPYFAAAAAGLKMAGYATSKTYHQKLSYIIVTYELWKFDMMVKRDLNG
ncbi:MAG: glucosaminidase domain-containing protein [Bacteroidota bacterium]